MAERTNNFNDGQAAASNGVATPAPVGPTPVKPMSVLQPVSSSGLGHAAPDRERILQGQQGSNNGASTATSQLQTQRKYPFIQV